MENRRKYLLFFAILTIVAQANAQTTETDTLYYYDRDSDDFIILLTCFSCESISVGFDLISNYSYSIEEIKVSVRVAGSFEFSIHSGFEFPMDSNKIYQDTVIIEEAEKDSIIDSVNVFKTILLGNISELNDLKDKFWFVLDIQANHMNNRPLTPGTISEHSFFTVDSSDSGWGSWDFEWVVEAIVNKKAVGIDFGSWTYMPNNYSLLQNYPNPFNSRTTISYEISHRGDVELVIYDIQGREIMKLYEGYSDTGRHEVTWNGS